MALTFGNIGQEYKIQGINGNSKSKHFLEKLGFVLEAKIILISKNGGNIIVNVKNSRIAISKEMANKIIIK